MRGRLTPDCAEHERTILEAQIAAAGGHVITVRRLLEGYVARHGAGLSVDAPAFHDIATACLATGQFELAAQLLRAVAGLGWRPGFSLAPDDAAAHPAVVGWRVTHAGASSFEFHPGLFRQDYTWSCLVSWVRLLPLFDAYHRRSPVRPGRTKVTLWDRGLAPGLCFSSADPDSLLIPDPEFISKRGYADERAVLRRARPAWTRRRPIAFWRGATTGRLTGDWRTLQRVRLCQAAAAVPALADAGITSLVQIPRPQWEQDLKDSGLMKAPVSFADFARYKYQIDIDGNSNAWAGLFLKLLTASPVLKVASPAGYRQWYYDRLEPWVNFVPVHADLTDLEEKILWLREHDDRARDIGRAGRRLAESLTFEGELDAAAGRITATFSGRRAR